MVFYSDSRTNAGIDQVSTYGKMYRFGIEGRRQFFILTTGNLATTQAAIAQVKRDIKERTHVCLLNDPTFSEAADYLGGYEQGAAGKAPQELQHVRSQLHHRRADCQQQTPLSISG